MGTRLLEAHLCPEKLKATHTSLHTWANNHRCSKQELLSLIHTLSFATKVIPAGKTFLRRTINLSCSVSSPKLPYPHFLTFPTRPQMLARLCDLLQLLLFLPSPTLDPSPPHLQRFNDSSEVTGFGAYCYWVWFNHR